ncbi:MORN repeat-containing protein 5 [Melanaphis sacchari]|uniref:MORN repeat-containing protein 5 n=1 Tax=Melanaphis sacchari TaxID=742174 RepID=UPI000DC14EDE|nr:MORN repeat-containing protein 5 [Melanaphis sacchari]
MSYKAKESKKQIKFKCKPQLHPSDQWVSIGTGNYYKGKWNHRTMSGDGIYVMQNGTVYEGNFDDGLFHGDGSIYYSSGSRIEGVWEKGKCVQQNYIFSDGLRFQQNNWQYCKVPDRRFAIEHVNGFESAARSYLTNRQPTIVVPNGAYDAGDGFYWPLTNTVHNYWTSELIRVPTVECSNWIIENCHRGGRRVVGFQPEFYKNWYSTTEENEGESTTADNKSSKQFIHDDQSIMAEIKSVPWFDLSLPSIIQSIHEPFLLDQFSSSSSSSSLSVESFQLSRCQRTLMLTD